MSTRHDRRSSVYRANFSQAGLLLGRPYLGAGLPRLRGAFGVGRSQPRHVLDVDADGRAGRVFQNLFRDRTSECSSTILNIGGLMARMRCLPWTTIWSGPRINGWLNSASDPEACTSMSVAARVTPVAGQRRGATGLRRRILAYRVMRGKGKFGLDSTLLADVPNYRFTTRFFGTLFPVLEPWSIFFGCPRHFVNFTGLQPIR